MQMKQYVQQAMQFLGDLKNRYYLHVVLYARQGTGEQLLPIQLRKYPT